MLEPAKTVITICGGVAAASQFAEVHPSNVFRWGYPKDRGGTGGRIPSDKQPLLLAKARHLGLRPDHFFLPEEVAE